MKSVAKKALALLSGLLLLSGSGLMAQGLEGNYEVVPPMVAPKAHSLDKVVIHEVFYFGCPHCYDLHKEMPAFLAAFKGKVQVISVPNDWGSADPGRLLYIARTKGPQKEEEVKTMIFDFIHTKGLGKSMFSRDKLQFVAKLNGLTAEFETLMDDPKIVAQMDAGVAYAKEKGVESTPTLILQDSVKVVGSDMANLKRVVNSLLKEPVP